MIDGAQNKEIEASAALCLFVTATVMLAVTKVMELKTKGLNSNKQDLVDFSFVIERRQVT